MLKLEISMPQQASPQLSEALSQLPLCRLVFVHRFLDDAALDPFKGNLWHGLFGACLHDLEPAAFEGLMGLDDQRRNWALVPPLDTEDWIPAGAEVQAALTLIGPGVQYAGACVAALAEMGRRGFGHDRAKAELLQVAVQGLDDSYHGLGAMPSLSALDVWQSACQTCSVQNLAQDLLLQLHSPLRIKSQGEVLREPPELATLLRRVMGRLVMLSPVMDNGLFAPGEQPQWLDLAATTPLLAHHLEGYVWTRRSSRQRQNMPFEGLLGRLHYGAPAAQLYPWFALAEWLQIGSKTSFGLGVIEARLSV